MIETLLSHTSVSVFIKTLQAVTPRQTGRLTVGRKLTSTSTSKLLAVLSCVFPGTVPAKWILFADLRMLLSLLFLQPNIQAHRVAVAQSV
jgi:hypothetical protein